MANRVLMIGLDGASPTLVKRWRAFLPNLSRLMENGAWGVLRSTIPHYTLPAWPSMVTGVHPGKLGFYGFRRRMPGSYRFAFNSLSDSPALTVWDILTQEERRSGVVGLPGTFPPQKLNGFMVSGFPAPANSGRLVFTYPEELSGELNDRFGLYESQAYEPYIPGKEQNFIDAWRQLARSHWEAATWLAESREWDFLAMVSLTIDRASHYLWRFTDPKHPDYDPVQAQRWGNTLRDFYRLEDKYVGRLVEKADESDLILITSDHGFCGLYRTFQLNQWLQQQGYLQLQTQAAQRKWLGRLAGRLVRFYRRNARARLLLAPLRRTWIRDILVAANQAYRYGQVRFENAAVDWPNTTAYALAQDRIYLNLQGRQPQGQVRQSDYDRVLANLVRDISSLKDERGNSVPVQFLRGRDVYEGPFIDAAPDLLIFVDNYRCLVGTGIGRKKVLGLPRRLSGTHHPDGLLVVRGPGVRTGKRIDADIVDIAPTILHALGAPVPAESDGRPLMEAFMESSAFVQKPVRTVKSSDDGDTDYTWSDEDEAQIMQQLGDLGYL